MGIEKMVIETVFITRDTYMNAHNVQLYIVCYQRNEKLLSVFNDLKNILPSRNLIKINK